jgi:hypothetical protein
MNSYKINLQSIGNLQALLLLLLVHLQDGTVHLDNFLLVNLVHHGASQSSTTAARRLGF